MHLHTACLLACISLQLSRAVGNWEIINDVKPYDESGTQDDILSREEFLPFRASKQRPKPAPQLPQKNVDSSNSKKTTKAPSLPVKGGNYIGEEELLPLGVQNHGNRRLLQVSLEQGPKLSPEMELLRRKLPSEAVNLSSACKESDDSDCLFNVDEYLAKQIKSGTLQKAEQDFEFDDQERDIVPVRHKRQAQTAPDPDDIEEGSGTSETDNVYTNTTEHVQTGNYYIYAEVGFKFSGPGGIDDVLKKKYQTAIQAQMAFLFQNELNFIKPTVGEPVLENGVLKANVTLVYDGSLLRLSANKVGQTNLEEYLLNSLQNATIPGINNLTININGLNVTNLLKLGVPFRNKVRDTLSDYCSSNDPCPDGPEYNITACVSKGFMSGSCPHKCTDYPCLNKALCELNENYEPICNCGDLYEGTFCEVAKEQEQGLTTGETVGVGLAGFAVAALLLSCCVYIVFFRRNKGVKYTYYEDEGSQDNLTDPTSIANYYIDRPIISATPIPVFNSQEGFDA